MVSTVDVLLDTLATYLSAFPLPLPVEFVGSDAASRVPATSEWTVESYEQTILMRTEVGGFG